MILNYEKKILEWLIVELLPVVRDQDSRDLVPVDDVSLDEVSYIFLRDGGQGFSFHPFGEVVNAYYQKLQLDRKSVV